MSVIQDLSPGGKGFLHVIPAKVESILYDFMHPRLRRDDNARELINKNGTDN